MKISKNNLLTNKMVMSLAALLLFTRLATGQVIYVDDDANGLDNGSSWANAYHYLQDALAAAGSGDEIRIAQGTYKPDQGIGVTPGVREATFQLKYGVAIYCGFAGTETALAQRNVQNNVTILSGDIGVADDPNDNCYHVFYHPPGTDLDATAVLDGFTVTGGNANASFFPGNVGAGI